MKIICTLPTYNESGHIIGLIENILSQDKNIEVLVIDDLSPDGTGNIVQEIGFATASTEIQAEKYDDYYELG